MRNRFDTEWPWWGYVLFYAAAGAMLGWTIVGWVCE